MAKKDFTASTDNVFDDFFTQPTELKKKEETKVVNIKKGRTTKRIKMS